MLLELLVKLIEVGDKVLFASQSEVALGVNSDVQVVALVGIEGCVTSGHHLARVVCKTQ